MKKTILIVILLVVLTIPSVWGLLHPGFFQSDDGEWMVIRFSAFYQALRDGQIPVRWLSRLNFEYGYPVANFLYPGFMYLGVPLKVIGFGFVNTVKIILGLSMIGSAVFTYAWLSKLFNRFSAFLGALFYLYAPYHLYDLYKRGSVGEILALAMVPFIFWQIEQNSFFWTTLSLGFLILAHNTLAFLFFPIIIVYYIVRNKNQTKKYLILNTLYIILLSIGLSAFFWIPAIFDLKYTIFSQTKVSDFQNYFADLHLIGGLLIFVLLYPVIVLLKNRLTHLSTSKLFYEENRTIFLLFLFVALLTLLLSTSASTIFWKVLPVSFVQFPFRFLSVFIFAIAFLVAYYSHYTDETKINKRLFITIVILVGAFIFYDKDFFQLNYFDKGDSYYATNVDTTTVKNEYTPKWVEKKPTAIAKSIVEAANSSITLQKNKSNNIVFWVDAKTNDQISINQLFFPGWRVYMDGRQKAIHDNTNMGIMQVLVSPGKHIVEAKFRETQTRLIADTISFISFIILCLFSLNIRFKIINHKSK